MNNLFFPTSYDANHEWFFWEYWGRYAPEMLIPELERVEKTYLEARKDPVFEQELRDLYCQYAGRPTPLYHAKNLSEKLGGAQIFLKNEGLLHTGAHKMNHCLGHALIAQRMGKKRIIAETGAGQHGLATATMAAKMGFACTIYMGEIDYNRQRPNVLWMEMLGAEVVAVKHGTRILKDAITGALQDWISTCDESYYVMGTAAGPHPFPSMVADFQSIIGIEIAEQLKTIYNINHPDMCVACVGGGCNSLGSFRAFLDDRRVQLIWVEAGGTNPRKVWEHAVRFQWDGSPWVSEGYKSYFIQDKQGNMMPTHSISAGLDYVGVGPAHSFLHEMWRVQYVAATDDEVRSACQTLARTEWIIAALESSHAVAHAIQIAPNLPWKNIVVTVSGRGDKDLFIHGRDDEKFLHFLTSYTTEYDK